MIRLDREIDREMDERSDRQEGRQAGSLTDSWKTKWITMSKLTGHRNSWTDGRTDTDRQADR